MTENNSIRHWQPLVTQVILSLKYNDLFIKIFLHEFCLHMYVYNVCAQCTQKSQVGDQEPTRTGHGCELPCGYGKLNLGPFKEQRVLLTTEASFRPPDKAVLTVSYPALSQRVLAANSV